MSKKKRNENWDDDHDLADIIEEITVDAEWHKETLDDRRQRVADGTAQFVDWESAKTKIREKTAVRRS